MKIVIDIPEAKLKALQTGERWGVGIGALEKAVLDGTPLPKGHGRLIDADQTLATAWANFYVHGGKWQKKDTDYVPFGRFYDQNGFECCQQTIVHAPTIIEADKTSHE